MPFHAGIFTNEKFQKAPLGQNTTWEKEEPARSKASNRE
jgi:hypothetical protein